MTRTPSDALIHERRTIRDLVARHRARNPPVFGSVAKGVSRDDSDLDLLVETTDETTLLDLGGLQLALEEALEVRVDLVTPRDLPAPLRDRILAEAVPV